jgi:sugar diacid utilization regulator
MQLSASHRGTRVVVDQTLVYALVPMPAGVQRHAADVVREQLVRFAARADTALKAPVRVGIGSPAGGAEEIALSRRSADEVLRVLRREPARGPVADITQLRSVALLMRFAQECGDDPLLQSGPLGVLREHDERRGTDYVPTLRAYLDAFGDVDAAAAALGVHANTVRYRLRQAQALAGIEMAAADDRLALTLQLHVLQGA